MRKSPCLGCEDREVGCHGSCETYQEFRAAQDEYIETIRKNRAKENITYTPKSHFNIVKDKHGKVYRRHKK